MYHVVVQRLVLKTESLVLLRNGGPSCSGPGIARYLSRSPSSATCGAVVQVAGDAVHLTGFSVSSFNNVVHPSVEIGSKTTVRPRAPPLRSLRRPLSAAC